MSKEDSKIDARYALVNEVLIPNGIYDSRVLSVMQNTLRHIFLHSYQQSQAYQNEIMPIAYQQMMMPPLLIAQMLQILALKGNESILEVGTGTGYLTALLAKLGRYVFSLERIIPLADRASQTLSRIACRQVDLHIGDGSQGLADMSPFDVIIVTASVSKIPRPLAMQLVASGGRMLIPVGQGEKQSLRLIQREGNRWHMQTIVRTQFPSLIGRYGSSSSDSPSIAGK
jgi:protein-L-isoaspartate(D-aspartate) O-methyltransferase